MGKLAKFSVACSDFIYERANFGSKYSIVNKAAPASIHAISGSTKLIWNIGRGSHILSVSVILNRVLPASIAGRTNASWVIGHPFGFAVVPDVYIIIAMSRTCRRERLISIASSSIFLLRVSNVSVSSIPVGIRSPKRIIEFRFRASLSSSRIGSVWFSKSGNAS